MDSEVRRRVGVCENAQNAEWEEVVAMASSLNEAQRAFLAEHPPGLIKALWNHFDATRDRCGCTSPAHEQPGCAVRLIERILLDEQSA